MRPKQSSKKLVDRELCAMQICLQELVPLKQEEQVRIFLWLAKKMNCSSSQTQKQIASEPSILKTQVIDEANLTIQKAINKVRLSGLLDSDSLFCLDRLQSLIIAELNSCKVGVEQESPTGIEEAKSPYDPKGGRRKRFMEKLERLHRRHPDWPALTNLEGEKDEQTRSDSMASTSL